MTNQSKEKALSIIDILAMKGRGEKISCLTAYDAGFASIIDRVGIDIMLVGDSLGMVVQGHTTTVPVTIENMLYHTTCVTRVRKRAFVISDLPFNTYSNPKAALKNAARLMQEAGAHMVKLEGARPDCVRLLIQEGIPVCGHLGLQPQSIFRLGSYGVQGKEPLSAQKIRHDAAIITRGRNRLIDFGMCARLACLRDKPRAYDSRHRHRRRDRLRRTSAGLVRHARYRYRKTPAFLKTS